MGKKVFRSLWSLDIVGTEKWLIEMASKGYILKNINLIKSTFEFEEEEPVYNRVYKIYRHKKGVKLLTKSLIDSGWKNIFTSNRWDVIENKEEDIKLYPSREGILNRNKYIKYILIGLLAYRFFLPTIFFITFTLATMFTREPVIVTRNPGAMASRIIMLLIVAFTIYIILKVNKSDREIRAEGGKGIDLNELSYINDRLDSKTEGMLKRDKKIIKRYKFAWIYAPDKLQSYLEEMELKGYNLYKVSRLGSTFYFIKGDSKKITYFVDRQNSVSDGYYEINKQDGWIVKFTSTDIFKKYIILAKEYTEEKPEFYSDKEKILKQARNDCIVYCSIGILCLVIYTKIIVSMSISYEGYFKMSAITYISIILIAEWVYFSYLSIGYYRRVKKNLNS